MQKGHLFLKIITNEKIYLKQTNQKMSTKSTICTQKNHFKQLDA